MVVGFGVGVGVGMAPFISDAINIPGFKALYSVPFQIRRSKSASDRRRCRPKRATAS
jgi:hypothetical protein